MSAIVCGKRSFFEELPTTPPPVSKRLRCCSPSGRLFSSLSPSSSDNNNNNNNNSAASALSHLMSLFPDMDDQILEKALKACDNDLDSAIKSLNELRLGSAGRNSGAISTTKSDATMGASLQIASSQRVVSSDGDAGSDDLSAPNHLPADGFEWVELFVREMMNASDMDDARARASRVLEVLEKSITTRTNAEATQSFQKENMMLKEQVEVLIRDNSLLKRAVMIQHERQKEYDERSQELQHLKQLVSQYQEQLRTLEVNNYALTMHLRQAQQSNSIPGRFHPDVF
eukprot:TRINITY_DN2444_c0_g1_i1.p1 TRINITY_DN2444_c0_g1~~TRINITY_DN2444_c0_g1_i1.p1  ORF type:complete len:300 (-),score=66.71 TRINITY_DN2444_c0_g1_i1:625-1482(-)